MYINGETLKCTVLATSKFFITKLYLDTKKFYCLWLYNDCYFFIVTDAIFK